jgi:hypothetical protein
VTEILDIIYNLRLKNPTAFQRLDMPPSSDGKRKRGKPGILTMLPWVLGCHIVIKKSPVSISVN